jgi:omega-amidase
MIIALASLNQEWENKLKNLQNCELLFEKAKNYEASMIIFPEMTLTGFSMNTEKTAELLENSMTIESFKSLAKRFSMGVLFGVVIAREVNASNCAVFIDDEGIFIAKYEKIHPFSFAGEQNYFSSGNNLLTFKFKDLEVGVTICYDLRFPEIYSVLGRTSDLIVNIANWPSKRIDHWDTLLKARAIENQVFMAGINRIGSDPNGNEYVKCSRIINPYGSALEPIITEDELDVFEVNKDEIVKLKSEFSTTQDRKSSFYRSIL